tara:strand:- start:5326 stop:6471 length:1146 start_codon:yes stop_codon:yes gene_type:complete
METQTKKKILFLITKSNWGGAQRYVYDLATNLPTARYEPVVALGGDGPLRHKLVTAGVRVITIPHLERDISLRKELLASWSIAHLIRGEDPDVLHVNSSKAGAIGAFLGRILGVPRVIFTAHGWAFNEDRSFIQRFIFKVAHWLTVLLAHHTICVSHALKSQLRWPGAQRKMSVTHLGREATALFDRAHARALLAEHNPQLEPYLSDPWLISIGELHPVKQHDVAIEAVANLLPEHPNLRYLIIGDGQLRDELTSFISKEALGEHVFLLGQIDEAAQYLKAADVFVLPSRSEALGYVALEAAQAGIATVASNVGGIPEVVVNDVTGTLVPSGDSTALSAAIEHYLRQPKLSQKHAAAAREHAASFSIEAMVRRTTAYYAQT